MCAEHEEIALTGTEMVWQIGRINACTIFASQCGEFCDVSACDRGPCCRASCSWPKSQRDLSRKDRRGSSIRRCAAESVRLPVRTLPGLRSNRPVRISDWAETSLPDDP